MIPEYDALYDLKRQWYYEFLPFLSNQPGIDKLILGDTFNSRFFNEAIESREIFKENFIWISLIFITFIVSAVCV